MSRSIESILGVGEEDTYDSVVTQELPLALSFRLIGLVKDTGNFPLKLEIFLVTLLW